ncbi:MAG: hypothetical protein M3R38_34515, partial [Actinomycetota bacterium]|nr:hypothetical protein [Actinomycetota bacterium]
LINGEELGQDTLEVVPEARTEGNGGYRPHVEAAYQLLRSGRGSDAVPELARALELGGEEARREVDVLLGKIVEG